MRASSRLLPLSVDDDDRSADTFCDTQRMARTVLALPADALDDSGRQDQEW